MQSLSIDATVPGLTRWPWSFNASAKFRVLLQVHRSGDSGSPRVTGSTNFSKSLSNVGSRAANVLRPPPGWRIRLREEGLTGTSGEPWSSRTPRRIVVMERPVASTTAESPPHGNSRASAAAQCRRKDSSMVGPRAWYFRRRLSMISGSLISRAERCEGNLSSYFCAGPYSKRLRGCRADRRRQSSPKASREWPRRKPHVPPGPPVLHTLTDEQKALLQKHLDAA